MELTISVPKDEEPFTRDEFGLYLAKKGFMKKLIEIEIAEKLASQSKLDIGPVNSFCGRVSLEEEAMVVEHHRLFFQGGLCHSSKVSLQPAHATINNLGLHNRGIEEVRRPHGPNRVNPGLGVIGAPFDLDHTKS